MAPRPRGGNTRILIIDDDQRPFPGVSRPPHLAVVRGGASSNSSQALPSPRAGAAFAPAARLPEPAADQSLIEDVLVRVQALLGQPGLPAPEPEATRPPAASNGSVAVDLATQTVTRAGRVVRLTPTEFRLLVALIRQQGVVVSRQDLRRQLWGDDSSVSLRVVDVHVARLRRKLESDPKQPRHVLTALSAGYCFRP